MPDKELNCIIISKDPSWNSLLQETIRAQGFDITISDCIDPIFGKVKYSFILITAELYLNSQEDIHRLAKVIQPCVVPAIVLCEQLLPAALADDPFIYDTLERTMPAETITRLLGAYCKAAKREWLATITHFKNSKMYAHINNERDVTQAMYEKICGYSCFDSINIDMHFSYRSLYKGDILLAARKPTGDLHIMLGDFSGQGLTTAVGALPASEIFYGMTKKGFSFESILREINTKMKSILPTEIYCAAAFIEYNTVKSEIRIWNGGMPDILVLSGEGAVLERIPSAHLPLGVKHDGEFNAEAVTITPEPSDSLLLYCNSIFKLLNEQDEMFGAGNFENLLTQGVPSRDIIAHLKNNARTYSRSDKAVAALTLLRLGFLKEPQHLPDKPKDTRYAPKPVDWSLEMMLLPYSLRNFDPLPVLLHIIMDQPGLELHRSRIYAILAELYSNALDHGILGLDSTDKADLSGFADYYRKRNAQLNALENAYIKIKLCNKPEEIGGRLIIIIEDSGPGFNYKKNRLDYSDNKGYSGRGMPMIQDMCESVRYFGRGNCVEAIYRWQ